MATSKGIAFRRDFFGSGLIGPIVGTAGNDRVYRSACDLQQAAEDDGKGKKFHAPS